MQQNLGVLSDSQSWVLRVVRRIFTLSCELRREDGHSNVGIQSRQDSVDIRGIGAFSNVCSLESSGPCNGSQSLQGVFLDRPQNIGVSPPRLRMPIHRGSEKYTGSSFSSNLEMHIGIKATWREQRPVWGRVLPLCFPGSYRASFGQTDDIRYVDWHPIHDTKKLMASNWRPRSSRDACGARRTYSICRYSITPGQAPEGQGRAAQASHPPASGRPAASPSPQKQIDTPFGPMKNSDRGSLMVRTAGCTNRKSPSPGDP